MWDLARSLGVELRIRMGVSDAELVETLNRAALLLYTSRLEPFGFAPLEANACGLPVVGIAEGGIRETVQDGVSGFLVEPEAESIAGPVYQQARRNETAGAPGQAAERGNEVKALTDELQRLRETYAAREQLLDEILNSKSFRLVSTCWRLRRRK